MKPRLSLLRAPTSLIDFPEMFPNRVDPASCPTGPPTDPDMQISRIRLLVARLRYATQMAWTIHPPGLGCPCPSRAACAPAWFRSCRLWTPPSRKPGSLVSRDPHRHFLGRKWRDL